MELKACSSDYGSITGRENVGEECQSLSRSIHIVDEEVLEPVSLELSTCPESSFNRYNIQIYYPSDKSVNALHQFITVINQ
jgi:hypothetical protein